MNFVWTPLLFILTDAQFTSFPASTNTRCIGNELDLHWIYSVVTNNASSVEWKKDGLIMLTWIVEINNYGYENGYNSSKLVHNGNGNVDIKMLAPSDAGEYVCEVTYDVTGTTYPSTAVTLTVSSCKPSEDSSDTAAILGGTAGAVLGIGGTLGIVLKVCKDKKKKEGSDEEQNKGSDEEQNKDKKDKKKDKKDKKKGLDEEQNKVEHIDERQPNHGTYDSLLAEDKQIVPPNRLPPINKEEIKKEKEKETNENKTK